MKLIIITVTLLIVGCGTVKTNNNLADSVSSEDFKEFFDKFKNDSLFQIERVKFPLRVEYRDIDDGEFKDDKIELINWRHLNLDHGKDYMTIYMAAYTQELTLHADSAEIDLFGIDNGFYKTYYFAKLNGKWYLISLKDLSD